MTLMAIRTGETQCLHSVRLESDPARLSDGSREPLARSRLNIAQLIKVLKLRQIQDELQNQSDEGTRSINNGKKRSAPSATSPRKRAKTKVASRQRSPDARVEGGSAVHVYSHTFQLGYTRDKEKNVTSFRRKFADDQKADELGWLQEEADLINILSEKSEGATNSHTFELGNVTMGEHWENTEIFYDVRLNAVDDQPSANQHLLTLPTVSFLDDRSPVGDVMAICWELQCKGRVSTSASASVIYIPSTPVPELPVQIQIRISVSLVIPAIFSPTIFHTAAASSLEDRIRRFLSYIFGHRLTSTNGQENVEEVSIQHFYSILEPAPPVPSLTVFDALQPKGLRATLLPFQRRSVKWLLGREGKTIDAKGQIIPKTEETKILPLFWETVDVPDTSAGSHYAWYYNRLTGSLREDRPPVDNVAGAMLCEEMGLGKTLECIALILLSPTTSRSPEVTRWDPTTELEVSQIKTNLIITPATLSQQWVDEIAKHAPELKTLFYTGYNKTKQLKGDNEALAAGQPKSHHTWCSLFNRYDVVITTYNVLQAELGVAKAPIVRPKRQAASYSHVEKIRSPLVRVEWARVLMDEVQLVGGGKTAEMVSLIPRAISIAVSGTPARSKVSDLSHVLKFLRVHSAIGSSRTWDRLLKPESKDLFTDLFRRYAIRTLKAKIQDELTIPSQRRFAVGIEFGRIEKHIYDQTLQEALDDLGVDARGVAASEGWEINISALRAWLRRLRQICTHPQVGNNAGTAARPLVAKTIKTLAEVLQGKQHTNWQSLVGDRRSKLQLTMRRAQLMQKVDDDLNRYQRSRDVLLAAEAEIKRLMEGINIVIAAHEERGKELREEAAALRRDRKQLNIDGPQDRPVNGKGKAREMTVSSSDEGSEDGDLPHTQIGEEYRVRQRTLQARLREGYILQHKVSFLLGDVYHILGASHAPAEDAAYAAAEDSRRMLLKATEETAKSAMTKLTSDQEAAESVRKKDLKLGHCQKGGIRSSHLMEEANDAIDLLNEQADLLWRWRTRIYTLLTKGLSAEGAQADGDEYARSLDTQGEVESYLQAYTALIADRKEGLHAERTALATHNALEPKKRRTMAARKAQFIDVFDEDEEMDDIEIEPEHQVLQKELTGERKGLKNKHHTRALKAVMFDLREISNAAGNRSEKMIAKDESKHLRTIISEQGTAIEKLELELASFRKAFNERIQYFKQLQELSDSVVEVEWEGNVRAVIESLEAQEDDLTMTINRKRATERHLETLAKDNEEGALEQEKDCVLCRCPFQRGLITQCAHIFCESCLLAWLHKRTGGHANCPVCRASIDVKSLQRISLDDEEYQKQLEKSGEKNVEQPPAPGRSVQFNSLPQETLDEIQTFETHGSYGSKITQLVRHLLYLQTLDPGSKSVVFSAWSDSLTIIEHALADNGIRSIRVDQKGKQDAAQKFQTDPRLLVFLLHGERDNAGLNLTCAKRVWLIEPTVNHSFEVQAIARVDRMGQTSATEVFCYFIRDTVEENILRMGAKGGLSLYTKDHSGDAINISSFAMGNTKTQVDSPSKKSKQKGDFIEKADDMIHVLFPHLDYSEEEFAGLTEMTRVEETMDMEGMEDQDTVAGPSRNGTEHTNAIAGPSRLH